MNQTRLKVTLKIPECNRSIFLTRLHNFPISNQVLNKSHTTAKKQHAQCPMISLQNLPISNQSMTATRLETETINRFLRQRRIPRSPNTANLSPHRSHPVHKPFANLLARGNARDPLPRGIVKERREKFSAKDATGRTHAPFRFKGKITFERWRLERLRPGWL